MTLNQFIELEQRLNNGEEIFIPFHLHEGIRTLNEAFGSAGEAAIFLSKILEAYYTDDEKDS